MMVWIEQCQQNSCSLTWDGVVSLVKEVHCNGDPHVTQMVLDLIYGLRDTKVRISLISTHRLMKIILTCLNNYRETLQSYVLTWL